MLCSKVETRLHYCDYNPQFPYLYFGGRPGSFLLGGSVTEKSFTTFALRFTPWLYFSSNLTGYYVALDAQIGKNMGLRAEYNDSSAQC